MMYNKIMEDFAPIPPMPPIPPTEPLPSVKPTTNNKNKTWLWILVSILMLIAGTAIGMLLGNKLSQKPVTYVTPTPLSSPSSDPTTNWKTYTNSKLGFSLKYPQEWIIDSSDENKNNDLSIIRFGLIKPNEKSASESLGIAIYIESPQVLTTFEQIKNNLLNPINISLDNSQAVTGYSKEDNRLLMTYAIHDKRAYTIITVTKNLEAEQTIYNQILSTFKFTQ